MTKEINPRHFVANRMRTIAECGIRDHMEMYNHLKENHPVLYGNIGFECGTGWWLILHDMATWIEFQVEKNGFEMPEMQQIKEKFGGLRYYYQGNQIDDRKAGRLSGYIEAMENKASETCEICGEKAEIKVKNGWYRCQCEPCEANAEDRKVKAGLKYWAEKNDVPYEELGYAGIGPFAAWECETKESPTGLCFYNVKEDPMMDSCLICGDPHERK